MCYVSGEPVATCPPVLAGPTWARRAWGMKSSEGSGAAANSAAGLREQTVSSIRWTSSGVVVLMALQLVYTMSIARLVEPDSFGVVAAGMVAIAYFGLLSRFGLDSALIQRERIDEHDVAAATTVAVLTGALGYALLFVSAPLFSRLFDQPLLTSTLRWMGLALVIQTVGSVPLSLLRRNLDFRAISIIRVWAYAVSNIFVGLAFAFKGYGLTALVVVFVINPTAVLIMSAAALRWRPRIGRGWTKIVPFLRFGASVSIASILDALGSTIDTILVSRIGAAQLGQYSRATMLLGLPVEQMSAAGNQVIAPSLGKLQADELRFGEALGASIAIMSCAVLVPMAVGGAIAPALVSVVLGDGWDAAADVLPVVAIATGLRLITQVVTSAAEARGQVDARLRTQTVSIAFYAAAVALTVAIGPTVLLVAVAWLIGESFRLAAHLWLSVRWLAVGGKRLLARMFGAAAVAGVAATPGLLLARLLEIQHLLAVVLSIVAAAGVLVLAWRTMPRSQIRRDVEWSGVLGRLRPSSNDRLR
jgi:lipopolysaccharide exporter